MASKGYVPEAAALLTWQKEKMQKSVHDM